MNDLVVQHLANNNLQYERERRQLKTRLAALEAIAEAARSVLSEDGVREYLASYVMGIELMNRLDSLPQAEAGATKGEG